MLVSWTTKAKSDLRRIHKFVLNKRDGGLRKANRVVNLLMVESVAIDTAMPIIKGRQLKEFDPRQVFRAIVAKEYEMHFEIDYAQNSIFILDVWHTKENR